MHYLDDLNESQRQAVEHIEGPCMIIAGAGSGKTRVLTTRITHLIKEHKVDPFKILTLTFTNKASREMRERILHYAGTESQNVWMGTFHSVFARLLRAEAHLLGYTKNFAIYDADDSKALVSLIVRELNLDDKVYKKNVVFNRISAAKNRLVSWHEYQNNPIYYEDDAAHQKPELGRIYETYSKRCFAANAMDFDDLLYNTNILFKEHLDILNKYQQLFHYVLIDEFQDTNIAQYLIVKRLAAVRENICVVGDDAQSIYAFRGADIQNILNFEKDYPSLKTFKLEQNYRSTKTIVNAANSVIEKNQAQLKKNVWTDNTDGELIEIMRAATDNEEGSIIANSIFETKMLSHAPNNDFAVLYRTNSQSRAVEEALRRKGIKYRVVGGLSFYQRREIKDLLAYCRFVINPNDEASMRRIINLPKRGIGASSIEKLKVAAAEKGISVFEVMKEGEKILGKRTGNKVEEFATMITSFQLTAQSKDAFETTTHIAKSSGLLKDLYEDKTIEGVNRFENSQELLNAIQEFVETKEEEEDKSLETFLQDIALLTDEDRKDYDDDVVKLMTIHMSKGLEFSYLAITGMEENLFPSQSMIASRQDLEEERRLFYVAITRAKKKLILSYAMSRYRYGKITYSEPSRFLAEVDPQFVRFHHKAKPQSNTFNKKEVSPPSSNFAKNLRPISKAKPAVRHEVSGNFVVSDNSKLEEGMKVEHQKFGFGVVINLSQQEDRKKAVIKFEGLGEKTLLLDFAQLRICN